MVAPHRTRTGEFHPTPHLRFAVLPHTDTNQPVLQQLWVIDTVNAFGHLSGYDEEWRDVERVVLALGETVKEK